MRSQPLQRSVWKNLDHPASAGHPGHLGRAVDLRWTGPLLEEVESCSCGKRGARCGHPLPAPMRLLSCSSGWTGVGRGGAPVSRPGVAPSSPPAQSVDSSVPSLSIDSLEASELYVFQRIKPIECLWSF